MLNPGYSVIAKKKKLQNVAPPGLSFICPECKKVCLEVAVSPDRFRTKCSYCGSWVYGKKMVANNLK